ncbi:MAG: peptide deformylase [Alphaproteobacteria bacterium]|nr:peptide deformylase [Alphaproteobacteria bacterium]
MTQVYKVARMGDAILKEPAAHVEDPLFEEIQTIIENMKVTIVALKSTGVAAPQVYIPFQITVFRLRPHGAPDDLPLDQYPWTVMINPKIVAQSEKKTARWESCLSLPDLTGWVERFDTVTCVYLDENGVRQTLEAKGYLARVIQHECDHLQGVLYPERMTSMEKFGFRDEIQALYAKH